MRAGMRKQRGVTLTGMIMVSFVLVIALLLAFKIVPVYLDYAKINKQFKAMSEDPQIRAAPTLSNIKSAWFRQNAVDDIKFDAETIQVRKEGGSIVIEAEYSVKVPLFKNMAACFDFHASSDKP